MATASRRELAIDAILERLRAIAVNDGYATDLGASVTVNEFPEFGPNDPRETLVLLVGDDELRSQGHWFLYTMPVSVLVLVDAESEDGWRTVERGIADVKRAMELDDHTLGGLVSGTFERGAVEVIPRQPGSSAIGAIVPYLMPMKEGWGAP